MYMQFLIKFCTTGPAENLGLRGGGHCSPLIPYLDISQWTLFQPGTGNHVTTLEVYIAFWIRGGWQKCEGHNLPPMVWIGLTDLPEPPGPPLATPLYLPAPPGFPDLPLALTVPSFILKMHLHIKSCLKKSTLYYGKIQQKKSNITKSIGCYFTLFYVFYGCPLDEISGFCALQWQEEVDEMSGNRKYKLANFAR